MTMHRGAPRDRSGLGGDRVDAGPARRAPRTIRPTALVRVCHWARVRAAARRRPADLEEGPARTDDLGDLPLALGVAFRPESSTDSALARRAATTAATHCRRPRSCESGRGRSDSARPSAPRRRPVLVAPLVHANVSFDPSNLMPLDSLRHRVPNLRLHGRLGNPRGASRRARERGLVHRCARRRGQRGLRSECAATAGRFSSIRMARRARRALRRHRDREGK